VLLTGMGRTERRGCLALATRRRPDDRAGPDVAVFGMPKEAIERARPSTSPRWITARPKSWVPRPPHRVSVPPFTLCLANHVERVRSNAGSTDDRIGSMPLAARSSGGRLVKSTTVTVSLGDPQASNSRTRTGDTSLAFSAAIVVSLDADSTQQRDRVAPDLVANDGDPPADTKSTSVGR